METLVHDRYGDPESAALFPEEEKNKVLGPIYSKFPKKFKFTPGEKIALRLIKEMAQKLVDGLKLVTKTKPEAVKSNTKSVFNTSGNEICNIL